MVNGRNISYIYIVFVCNQNLGKVQNVFSYKCVTKTKTFLLHFEINSHIYFVLPAKKYSNSNYFT